MADSDSKIKLISGLAEILTKAAGALVGLSAIGYSIGYGIEKHYFHEAGASWVLGLLSSAEFIREGQVVMFTVGITFFLSVINLFDKESSAEKLKRKDVFLSIIAMIFLFAAFISNKYFDNIKLDYGLSVIAGVLMAAAAGFTVGELVARLGESEKKWGEYHLYLLLFFYFSAIAMAPYFIGVNRAKSDLDPKFSTLPVVSVSGEEARQWRLIRTVGENYLLVNLADKKSQREFRVVPVSASVVLHSNGIDIN